MSSQQDTNLQLAPASAPSLKDQPIEWARQHPIPTAIGALLLFGLATGGGDTASQKSLQRGALQDFNDQAKFSLRHEQQKMQLREEQFRIAVARQRSCLRLTLDGGTTAANIVEGMVVRDPHSGSPLAPGTFVCDPFGATAELNENGQMVNILHGVPDPGVTIQDQVKPEPQIETNKEVTLYAPTTNQP